MIIFNDCTWQKCSEFPNTNYLEGTDEIQPKWVVPDESEIATKIISTPYWEAVEDENGNLTDIIPVEPPVTSEDRILSFKKQLTALDGQAIRPLRAIAAGTDTDEDREILTDLERQAENLRNQIAELEYNSKEGAN